MPVLLRLSILLFALLVAAPRPAVGADRTAAQEPAALVAVGEILSHPDDDLPRRIRIRGVVTWRHGDGSVVQDETGGIWIDVALARQAGICRIEPAVLEHIEEGDAVEIVGRTNRGGYAPNLLPETVVRLEARGLPPARPFVSDRFFAGIDDCLRVEAAGIVQGLREENDRWIFLAADGPRRFTIAIPKHLAPAAPHELVDARVRCAGTATAGFNTRGEFLAPRVNVVRAADLIVEEPSVATAWESPLVPLHALASYRPELSGGHRVRVRGGVTFAIPGRFLYLQEGCIGVRVDTVAETAFATGELVEAVGFVDAARSVAGVVEADVRRLGEGVPLAPIPIDPARIMQINAVAAANYCIATPGDYYGCLVSFPARIVDAQLTRQGGELRLAAKAVGISGIAEIGVFDALRHLEPDTEVRVTGIVQPEGDLDADPIRSWIPQPVGRLQLQLRSAADVEVLRRPSWWKPHRLAAALAAVAGCALGAGIWVVLLRRMVARQLAVIETGLQDEAVAEERRRIAREFHDSLDQGLAAMALRLDVATAAARDEQARLALVQQRQVLSSLQRETRDFLWDLRDAVHVSGTLEDSLRQQLRNLETLSSVPLSLTVVGPPPSMPPRLHHDLVCMVREAVGNALKHARPGKVDVRVDATPGRREGTGLEVTIHDDGGGFDVDGRSHAQGHFGIRGMRERARRMGASLDIESGRGAGTRVTIRLPPRSASDRR
jgi:signal transduction histidine kinase